MGAIGTLTSSQQCTNTPDTKRERQVQNRHRRKRDETRLHINEWMNYISSLEQSNEGKLTSGNIVAY